MTEPKPFFGMSVWPGRRAGCSAVEVAPGRMALSIYFDPVDVVVNVPPFPGGTVYMVRFLGELASSANALALRLAAESAVDSAGPLFRPVSSLDGVVEEP